MHNLFIFNTHKTYINEKQVEITIKINKQSVITHSLNKNYIKLF